MESKAFEGEALHYVLVTPDGFEPGAGYPLVVLLHGFGAHMYDLAGLASAIDSQGYVYALPNGPHKVDLGMGATGYSWAGDRPGVVPPSPDAPTTESLLQNFLVEVMEQTGTPPGQMVLGGFSQGGSLTLRFGLERPETFAGLIVLSGAVFNVEELKARLSGEVRPVFVAHGRLDPMINVERGRGTKAFLEEAGYPLEYHEYDMGHEITQTVVDDLRVWLHRTLPPKGDGALRPSP